MTIRTGRAARCVIRPLHCTFASLGCPGPLSLLFAAALAASFSGGVRPAEASDWQGYAVIVGVSEYPRGYNSLQFCDDDALDLRDALLCDPTHWTSSNIEVILNRDAKFSYVRDRILAMQAAATGADDVFLFFFSGHGSRADDDSTSPLDGDEDGPGDSQDEVLVLWNDAGDDIDYIYDDHLGQWLSGFTCGNVCVIVDSCYSGGMAKAVGVPGAESWADGFARDLAVASGAAFARPGTKDLQDSGQSGLVALLACNENELSKEDPVLQNGVFTFFVVEGLRRASTNANPPDEYVSAEEVFAYAAPLTSSWDTTDPQNPQIYDADGASELKLLRAGDYGTFKVVRAEDLPFGGGCAGGGGGGGALAAVVLLLSAVLLALARKTRALALGAALAACVSGCLAYGQMGQYVWTPQGYVFAPGQAAPATSAAPVGVQPSPATPYYVWTGRGYVLVYPQPQPAAQSSAPAAAETPPPAASGAPAAAPEVRPAQPPPATVPAPQPGPAPVVMPPLVPADSTWQRERPKVGFRAGLVAPLGEQNAAYPAAAQAGLYLSGKLPGGGLEYEAGLDFFSLEGEEIDAGGDVACARLDLVFNRKGLSRPSEPYLAVGPRLYADRARTYWGTMSEVVGAIALAGGLRRPGTGWDARLGLDILVGSENIRGFASLLAGARF